MHSQKNGLISIEFLDRIDETEANDLIQEINEIYMEEEGQIWPDDGSYQRINRHELGDFTSEGSMIIARNNTSQIVGTIRLYEKDEKWYFGLLTTHRAHRGFGIATQMIQFVEKHLKRKDIHELYIEIIFSREFDMPGKRSLKNWYEEKGFRFYRKINFELIDPVKAKLIKTPSYFEILKKQL